MVVDLQWKHRKHRICSLFLPRDSQLQIDKLPMNTHAINIHLTDRRLPRTLHKAANLPDGEVMRKQIKQYFKVRVNLRSRITGTRLYASWAKSRYCVELVVIKTRANTNHWHECCFWDQYEFCKQLFSVTNYLRTIVVSWMAPSALAEIDAGQACLMILQLFINYSALRPLGRVTGQRTLQFKGLQREPQPWKGYSYAVCFPPSTSWSSTSGNMGKGRGRAVR